jgi:hypothetical protein
LARPSGAGRQPHADPERLAPRASGTEPARGRPADAPLQLGLARVEGITDRGIPRELVAGDRVELEQSAQERLRVVARKVAPLDESDRVREIGERQPVREARPVGALRRERGGDELARSSPAQAPATPQLLRSTHAAETTWRQSARRLRAEVETTQSAGAQAVIACLQGTLRARGLPQAQNRASTCGQPTKGRPSSRSFGARAIDSVAEVAGAKVYDDGTRTFWLANGYLFWIEAGPRGDSVAPTPTELAPLIRASRAVAPPS